MAVVALNAFFFSDVRTHERTIDFADTGVYPKKQNRQMLAPLRFHYFLAKYLKSVTVRYRLDLDEDFSKMLFATKKGNLRVTNHEIRYPAV